MRVRIARNENYSWMLFGWNIRGFITSNGYYGTVARYRKVFVFSSPFGRAVVVPTDPL